MENMDLIIVVAIFALALHRELGELRTLSLQSNNDRMALKIAVGLMMLSLVIGGIDRFQQWFEYTFQTHVFFINGWLNSIPYNDLSIYFNYPSEFLIDTFRAIYNYGFYVPFFGLLIRAVAKRDFRALSLLAFGTFAFHYLVHFPFYTLTQGHQVWMVKGEFPPLFRTISPLNHVFPSMHTSISVTYLLLAWKQPNKLIRVLYSIFCPLVIFATFYLRIHWTIDAIAGAAVGIAAVQFAQYATRKQWLPAVINFIRSLWGTEKRRDPVSLQS